MRKGNKELKAAVDKAIQSMLADGTILELSEKYFPPQTIALPSAP